MRNGLRFIVTVLPELDVRRGVVRDGLGVTRGSGWDSPLTLRL
jgi:hypothetical protein